MALLNLGISNKGAARIRRLDAVQAAQAREKFYKESGVRIEKVVGFVVDELSFIDLNLIGHLDARLQDLMGIPKDQNVPFGGLPVLFMCDNHQQTPPGGSAWYRMMVKDAETQGEVSGKGI